MKVETADMDELFEIWHVVKGKSHADLLWGKSTVVTVLPVEHIRELGHAADQHNAILGRLHEGIRRAGLFTPPKP